MRTRPHIRTRLTGKEAGVSLVEFALLLPLLLILIFALLDLGTVYYRKAIVARALSRAQRHISSIPSEYATDCMFAGTRTFINELERFGVSRTKVKHFTGAYLRPVLPWTSDGNFPDTVASSFFVTYAQIDLSDCVLCRMLGLFPSSEDAAVRVSAMLPLEGSGEASAHNEYGDYNGCFYEDKFGRPDEPVCPRPTCGFIFGPRATRETAWFGPVGAYPEVPASWSFFLDYTREDGSEVLKAYQRRTNTPTTVDQMLRELDGTLIYDWTFAPGWENAS